MVQTTFVSRISSGETVRTSRSRRPGRRVFRGDGADGIYVQRLCGVAGVGVEHCLARHCLRRVENAFLSLTGFRLIDRTKNICRGDRPIAGAGDDPAVVEDGARGILPLIDVGIDIGLQDFDGVIAGIGPEELKRADHTEFAEARKILGADELFVGDGVRKLRRRVGGASSGDAIKRGFHGAVTDGVNVDDQSLFVGETQSSANFLGSKRRSPYAAGVLVRLGEMRGLRGELGDTVGEDLDSGDVEVGNVFVGLACLLNGGQFS